MKQHYVGTYYRVIVFVSENKEVIKHQAVLQSLVISSMVFSETDTKSFTMRKNMPYCMCKDSGDYYQIWGDDYQISIRLTIRILCLTNLYIFVCITNKISFKPKTQISLQNLHRLTFCLCFGIIYLHNLYIGVKANIEYSDQPAQMCRLIWLPCLHKKPTDSEQSRLQNLLQPVCEFTDWSVSLAICFKEPFLNALLK